MTELEQDDRGQLPYFLFAMPVRSSRANRSANSSYGGTVPLWSLIQISRLALLWAIALYIEAISFGSVIAWREALKGCGNAFWQIAQLNEDGSLQQIRTAVVRYDRVLQIEKKPGDGDGQSCPQRRVGSTAATRTAMRYPWLARAGLLSAMTACAHVVVEHSTGNPTGRVRGGVGCHS